MLVENGLPIAHALALTRTWSQGACVHLQRAHALAPEWARDVDRNTTMVSRLLRHDLDGSQTAQLCLRVAEGGLGLGSAVLRAEAAFVGAWEAGTSHVASALAVPSMAVLRERWPAWAACMDSQDRRLRVASAAALPSQRWDALLGGGVVQRQRLHARKVHEHSTRSDSCGRSATRAA